VIPERIDQLTNQSTYQPTNQSTHRSDDCTPYWDCIEESAEQDIVWTGQSSRLRSTSTIVGWHCDRSDQPSWCCMCLGLRSCKSFPSSAFMLIDACIDWSCVSWHSHLESVSESLVVRVDA